MGRRPNYDLETLPQWVQRLLASKDERISDLDAERETLLGQIDNMEYALERMARNQVEEIAPGTFLNTVDL